MQDHLGFAAEERICLEAIVELRREIEEVGGREVFFSGSLDSKGRVERVRVCARGHEGAVPAVLEGLGTRDVVLHNHPSGDIAPSEADLQLASLFSFQGHGVYIVNNAVERVFVVVEPFLEEDRHHLSAVDLGKAFSPSGSMARSLPGFEVRPQQLEMMEMVADAFNEERIAVVEAPTGVGKTIAYLLPAVAWAIENRERVVVSTKTINLQEQIVHKDMPVLERCLDAKVKTVIVKGRSNYLCRRRFSRAISEASLFEDEGDQEALKEIEAWVENTREGSRSDLPFVPGPDLWSRICSESDSCRAMGCPEVKRCFVARARREIAGADVLVVNHHMLFSDLAIKREMGSFSAMAVLPAFRRVVFDEAHSLEDSATQYFGVEVTRAGALRLLGRFVRMERGSERGLLPYIKLAIIRGGHGGARQDSEAVLRLLDDVFVPSLEGVRASLLTVFDTLRSWAAERCGQIGRDIKFRLTEEVLADEDLREIHSMCVVPASEEVNALASVCAQLHGKLKTFSGTGEGGESPFAMELSQLQAFRGRLERLAGNLLEATSIELQQNTVRWIEMDSRKPSVFRVVWCPLDVGEALREWVYPNLKTIVMTSATLSVQGRFDYLFGRIGLECLEGHIVDTCILQTPFRYEQQAILGIPMDLAEPNEKAFLDDATARIRQVLAITRGHAFVLFTSFYALDYAYRRLAEDLRKTGIVPLRQGQAARTHLLNRFRQDPSSVLFATDSFWEGVDVAGEALQCVILPKLPFRVPTEPILAARAEAIDAAGGSSFMEYVVPQAVIKFRQGFGRLIRRRSDRGCVVVLDRRVVTKHYGRSFLGSLPGVRIVKGPWEMVAEALKGFHLQEREEE